MARRNMEMAAVLLLALLAMAQQSMQQSLKNPLPLSYRNIRTDDTPVFGLITTSYSAEKALNESGFFVPTSYTDLFGRRFVTGTIYGANVVYVRTSSSPSVHAGITTQIMTDYFNLIGIVHFGSAGTTNETLSIGTVSVPRLVGFTGSWEWLSKDSNEQGQLVIGDFNYPENGQNLLGSIKIDEVDVYYKGQIAFNSYWVYPHLSWLGYASRIKIESGDVIVGLNSSSSDIYVNNPVYREFLYKNFNVSTVDTSSGAVGLGAKSNSLSFISFQGISNSAGAGDSSQSATELASKNVVAAVINFIWQATVPRYAHDF
ncbi:bark storage protein A [Ricinus communis]|uniref:Mta/sah nucleosidase, putative n=1 Tax=Ricinus communis TaxID=3988 RepID=B9S220_RICCO|nr:bark storage protein A [Ricinus communis]EEF42363.1 mta/sah nucleosidase, putative [Ricinus communis]|eukprot:XP_002520039.1 bark storage protein A [Ricinus communis]